MMVCAWVRNRWSIWEYWLSSVWIRSVIDGIGNNEETYSRFYTTLEEEKWKYLPLRILANRLCLIQCCSYWTFFEVHSYSNQCAEVPQVRRHFIVWEREKNLIVLSDCWTIRSMCGRTFYSVIHSLDAFFIINNRVPWHYSCSFIETACEMSVSIHWWVHLTRIFISRFVRNVSFVFDKHNTTMNTCQRIIFSCKYI